MDLIILYQDPFHMKTQYEKVITIFDLPPPPPGTDECMKGTLSTDVLFPSTLLSLVELGLC